MGQDKGGIQPGMVSEQRYYMADLLKNYTDRRFTFPAAPKTAAGNRRCLSQIMTDTFTGLGPFGAILIRLSRTAGERPGW
jgi:hypothetical protein